MGSPLTSYETTFADIDGDGKPDLVALNVNGNSSTLAVYLNTSTAAGISFAASPAITQPFYLSGYTVWCLYGDNNSCSFGSLPQNSPISHFDFNGDGRSDVILVLNVPTFGWTAYEYAYNGTSFVEAGGASLGTGTTPNPFVALNFNDDACTDLMGTTELQISQCNGNGFLDIYIPSGGIAGLAVDWDGDGRTDILANVSGSWELYRSQGDAFATGVATGISVGTGSWVVTDQDGDGLDDLAFSNSSSGVINYGLHNGAGQPPDLATSFVDGFHNSATPSYVSMVSAGNYSVGATEVYPYQNYIGPLYIVNQVTFSDPSTSNGTYQQQFWYAGATINLQGRGFSGFGAQQRYDSRSGIWETWDRNVLFPYTGMLTNDVVSQNNFNTVGIRNSVNTLSVQTLDATANNERYFPYASNAVTQRFEVSTVPAENGKLISTASTNYGTPADSYGNFASVTTTITDEDSASPYYGSAWSSTVANTIAFDTTTWCLNLPSQTTVTNTAPNVPTITRTITYNNMDYTYCRETEKVIEPYSAKYKVVEDYGYDTGVGNFGNLSTVTVTGVNMTARQTQFNWGTTGQFLAYVVDAMGHQINFGFDPSSGMLTSQTDPNYTKANPLQTSWQYDDFARLFQETRLDGTYTKWTFNDCATSGGCLVGSHGLAAAHSVYGVNGSLINNGTTWYDPVDRPLVANNLNLSGGYDRNEVRYDSLGRVFQQAMPCAYGASLTVTCPYWTTNYYDILNRLTSSQRPISASNNNLQTTGYTYAGRTMTVTDPLGNQTTKITQVTGNLGRSQGANGYYQNFSYDSFGSLLSVTDSASPANTLFTGAYSYGIGAFQTSSTDMDLGARTYTIDAMGEVIGYKDAKSQSFSMTYDALSRPWVRTDPEPTGNGYVTTWNWGNSAASYNIGKLQSVTATSSTFAGSWSDTYTYDSYTRPSTETLSNPGDRTYEYITAYNLNTGLLASLQYPVETTFILTLQYAYSNGILQSISSNSYSPAVTYWTANAVNPRGQVIKETYGNGVVKTLNYDAVTGWLGSLQAGVGGGSGLQNNGYAYDKDGNLTQRQDNNQFLTENFYPDNMNRLDHSTLNRTINLQMTYDSTGMGNIAARSDVAADAAWTYDPVRKHAVTQAGSAAFSYTYDANGNMASRNGYTIPWTSYNYPLSVSSAGESVTLAYGGNRQRWQEVYTGGPNGTETTYHAGKLFEVAWYGGLAHYRHYVYAGNELVTIDDQSTASPPQYYVVSDHQGGIASLENSNSPGSSFVGESFTAFGNRRSAETWSGAPSSSDTDAMGIVTRRGYTGETTLGVSMGLNHLNGRVEDSITGRFLSPDPYIPDPGNTQSFNRYSYVNNNPLSFTDPSGFEPVVDPITVVGYLGGPENPWADAAGVVVAAADVLGFFSLFGGGVPTPSPSQQAAMHHGISLLTQLRTIQVTASSGSFASTSVAGIAGQFAGPIGVSALAATAAVDPDMIRGIHVGTTPSPSPGTELDTIHVSATALHGFSWWNLAPGWSLAMCAYYGCGAGLGDLTAQSNKSSVVQTACSFAGADSPDSNLDQITSVVGLYDDTGRAFGATGRSLVALGANVSRFAGPIGTALSAVQTASQVNNGQYLDAAFTTADFLLASGLSLTGPLGIAADVGLNAAGGTKAAARGAASLICEFGGGQ